MRKHELTATMESCRQVLICKLIRTLEVKVLLLADVPIICITQIGSRKLRLIILSEDNQTRRFWGRVQLPFWQLFCISSVSSVETCHSTMKSQSFLPTTALPQYLCMQIILSFSFLALFHANNDCASWGGSEKRAKGARA
ncbi:unnamed protein product, partial [Bubo scandiacus]